MENSINLSNKLSDNLILVAEDDDMNFELLHFVLSRMNYRVIRAINGEEAVSMFSQTPDVDLVLTDLSMPVMDGIEATKQIRKMNKDIPIIVQTGHNDFHVLHKAKEAGCNSFVIKPINRKDLLIKVKEFIKLGSGKSSQQYKSCG